MKVFFIETRSIVLAQGGQYLPTMTPKRRIRLTIQQKQAIMKEVARLRASTEKWSLHTLSLWTKSIFKLDSVPHRSTLSKLIKHKEAYESYNKNASIWRKTLSSVRCFELETSLTERTLDMWDRKVFVSESLIKEKAKRLLSSANWNLSEEQRKSLSFSNGWLDRFKKRNRFKSFMSHGEYADADESAITEELPILRQKTSQYALNDIFNAEEFGLFYQAASIRTIGPARLDGRKVRKERLIFLVCAKADGTDKHPLMVIGRSKHPRCFGSLGPIKRGFDYSSNSKAWMSSELIFEWLHRFDSYIGITNGRKALLLLDIAPFHGSIARLPKLSNVSVLFLPKRTTSRMQPMDAGVIAALKRRYM